VSSRLNEHQREEFDRLFQQVLDELPDAIHELIEEIPIIVLDRPTPALMRELGLDPGDEEAATELCGLHTGTALTERSVSAGAELPTDIHVFREGIINLAGGWEEPDPAEARERIADEIWVTLLHEIGHHFGLDEDDLARLGFD
jgi:predicted Zn-dependent protease with MMP-like domain